MLNHPIHWGMLVLVVILALYAVLAAMEEKLKNVTEGSSDADARSRKILRLKKGVYVLRGLLLPLRFVLEKTAALLLWVLGLRKSALNDNVTEEEIISIVNEGQEQGVLEESEAEMISNIIEFDEKVVKDVMTHRTKMLALSSETSIPEALETMLKAGYSRYPLYGENLDDIIGVLHLKDVVQCYIEKENRECPLKCLAREPYFVPDTQSLDALFHDMQSKKMHMAIAIDEYGQTAGLVAMEDILEEIVGDIQDEYDEEEELISKKSENCFEVSAEISLEELEEESGIEIREEDKEAFDTLNGLLVSLLGHIPQEEEKFTAEYEGFRFEALTVCDHVFTRVQVTQLPKETQEEEER